FGIEEVIQERLGATCLLGVVLQPNTMRRVILGFLGPCIEQVLASPPDLKTQPIRIILPHLPRMLLRSFRNGLHSEIQIGTLVEYLHGPQRRRHWALSKPDQSDQCCRQTLVQCPWRERRHTRSLHAPVERLVVRSKAFEMRPVPRLVNVENRHHQPRSVSISPYAACRLDVFCAGLGLSEHYHQPKARD